MEISGTRKHRSFRERTKEFIGAKSLALIAIVFAAAWGLIELTDEVTDGDVDSMDERFSQP